MLPARTPPNAVAANVMRTSAIAAVIGGIGLLVASLLGYAPFALFGCAGLALGALNSWLVQRSATRYAASSAPSKRQFGFGALGRLALITVLAVAVALLVQPAGIGVFVGLAIFQFLILTTASVPLIKELRQQ